MPSFDDSKEDPNIGETASFHLQAPIECESMVSWGLEEFLKEAPTRIVPIHEVRCQILLEWLPTQTQDLHKILSAAT
jgi:hypothetical protein